MTGEEFKKKIKEYNDIRRGIKDLEVRIKKINGQIVQDGVKGSSPTFPYVQHTCIVEGQENSTRLKKRKKLLKKKQEELKLIKFELEEYINSSIDNERFRQLLEYKYIDEYSWIKISHKLGGTIPDTTLRKEFERFMKEI